jgi:murein DD-endopeptidase MepM/ murein hydrolase activator NlpD
LTERKNVRTLPPFPYTTTVYGGSNYQLARIRNLGTGKWTYQYRYFYVDGDRKATHKPPSAYSLPYASGASYPVTLVTGPEYHFAMPEETEVLAARPGTVVLAEKRYSQSGLTEEYYTKVNRVFIRHDDGTLGAYYHFRPGGVVVTPGEFVNQGQLLGYSGQTGHISSPQLTFFVFKARDGRSKQLFPLMFKTLESESTSLQSGERYTAASAYTF